jgi:hypothetical protein
MIFTGVYKNKKISISKKPFSKEWSIAEKEGRNKIYVIPAENLIFFYEKTSIRKVSELREYYKFVLEEKYGNINFDVHLENDTVYVLAYKNFDVKDYYALDGEIFSLLRIYNLLSEDDGYCINFEKEKLTFVSVKNKNIDAYRVILEKDADIVNNPDWLKENLPELENKPVLIVGDSRNINKLKEFFKDYRLIENPYCLNDLAVAFGGALKGILKDNRLSFRKTTLSEEDKTKFKNLFLISIASYLVSYFLIEKVSENKLKEIKNLQRQEFKKAFPDVPVVSPYMQIKSMVKLGSNFDLSKKLAEINLPKDTKIYSIEFYDGKLIMKGESSQPPENTKSVKKLPNGSFEFEIEVK